MNKMKTAVEWLIEQLGESGIEFYKYHDEILNQAKAMEEEQRQESYNQGLDDAWGMFYKMSNQNE